MVPGSPQSRDFPEDREVILPPGTSYRSFQISHSPNLLKPSLISTLSGPRTSPLHFFYQRSLLLVLFLSLFGVLSLLSAFSPERPSYSGDSTLKPRVQGKFLSLTSFFFFLIVSLRFPQASLPLPFQIFVWSSLQDVQILRFTDLSPTARLFGMSVRTVLNAPHYILSPAPFNSFQNPLSSPCNSTPARQTSCKPLSIFRKPRASNF